MRNVFLISSFIISILSYVCYVSEISCENITDYFKNVYNFIFKKLAVLIKPLQSNKLVKEKKLFTQKLLSTFDGRNGKIYLSILGQVFDVTKGEKHYGIGKTYHGFAGRDGSKAFITGEFTENGLTDDISDLSLSQLNELKDWLDRYRKDYIYKGKLIGRFYDENGKSTSYLNGIQAKFLEAAKEKELSNEINQKYPPCNVEWSQDKGSMVWCSNRSGGIKRDWVGVPRKLFMPGWKEYRCACVRSNEDVVDDGKLLQYDKCHPEAINCYVRED